MLSELPEDHGDPIISVKAENTLPSPPPGRDADAGRSNYDPGRVYLFEFCTVLALRDADTIAALGKQVADALFGVVRTAAEHHYILVSRTVFYLFQLLRAGYVCFHAMGLVVDVLGANILGFAGARFGQCPNSVAYTV